ncbi:obscurin-like isoform X1 [Xiphophorus maculatus]|uniref:obscurin-like isoform X1 n=1 Tax=Xiphophorus maculatus TaxID=8083 RepID=UPI000C6D4965|nr:obscurin-like isoform X1 [Xiphophorus maculatus]
MGHPSLSVLAVLCLSSLLGCRKIHEPKPFLTVSPSWLIQGASVNLSCEVEPSSSEWRIFWYKAVPDLKNKNYSYELLNGSNQGTKKDSFIITGQKHSAGFACRAERGNPKISTDYSELKFVWSAVPRPAASLTVSPDREKHFTDQNVSLRCDAESTGGRIRYYRQINTRSYLYECSTWWTTDKSSCMANSQSKYKAVYWCESGSEFSNAVNITIYKPKSVLTVSPSWPSPGASVTLTCNHDDQSAGWRFYWFKAAPHKSEDGYRYELLPDSISGTVQDSFIIHEQNHTSGYSCRAGRGNPELFTDYSEPKFVWSAVSHPAASLSVSPDREQHFTSESVTLNCGGNSTEWRVRRFSESGYLIVIVNCYYWGKMSGSSCIVKNLSNPKSVYWCESGSGEFSNAANITSHNEDLLLVSPVHPVTEGASVTLSCRLRGENQLSNVIFYHNDKLIQSDSRAELNISAVSQSDEGFYKCEHSGKVSPQSWMAVKGVSKPGSSSFPVLLVLGVVCGSVLVILLLLLCCFRLSKGSSHRAIQSEIAYQGSSIDQPLNQTSTNEYNLSSHDEDEAGDVTYAHIKFKKAKQATKSSKRGRVRHSALDVKGRPHDPEEGTVYADVRTAAAEALSAAAADAALYSEVRKGSKKRVS